ncbi:MAG: two-component system sensor histidine kinase NtrB [Caulobacteraceae bacterium]
MTSPSSPKRTVNPSAPPTGPSLREASDTAYLAAIVDSSHDAIIAKDLDGRITAWNRAAQALFGYAEAEVLGRHVSILFPEDRLFEEAEIMAKIRAAQRIEHYETQRRRKEGGIVDVSLTVSPILDADGVIIGASKIVQDIGARLKTAARLEELQQELLHLSRLSDMGQMASALAHELNQPLSSAGNYISGARRLLSSDEPPLATVMEGLDKATGQIQRVGEIVRRLRVFVERGQGERRIEQLAPVVEEAIALLAPTLRSQCDVNFSSQPDLEPVLIDRVQIQQVLLNLFRNAIEAMADQPVRRLLISTLADGADAVLVRVADTGPGIDPVVAERLFQPFVTSKSAGMGIGLSICRTIMEAHGGRIWAGESRAGGAEFNLSLPGLDPHSEQSV